MNLLFAVTVLSDDLRDTLPCSIRNNACVRTHPHLLTVSRIVHHAVENTVFLGALGIVAEDTVCRRRAFIGSAGAPINIVVHSANTLAVGHGQFPFQLFHVRFFVQKHLDMPKRECSTCIACHCRIVRIVIAYSDELEARHIHLVAKYLQVFHIQIPALVGIAPIRRVLILFIAQDLLLGNAQRRLHFFHRHTPFKAGELQQRFTSGHGGICDPIAACLIIRRPRHRLPGDCDKLSSEVDTAQWFCGNCAAIGAGNGHPRMLIDPFQHLFTAGMVKIRRICVQGNEGVDNLLGIDFRSLCGTCPAVDHGIVPNLIHQIIAHSCAVFNFIRVVVVDEALRFTIVDSIVRKAVITAGAVDFLHIVPDLGHIRVVGID